MRIPLKTKGFTIIELMIVVTIISIIAAIAIPNYLKFAKRAKEAVIHENMHTIHLAIEAFSVASLGVYPLPADEPDVKLLLPQGRYPENPFTNAETVVIWNGDPANPGEISITNLPGGGIRIRGHGVAVFLKDITTGD